LREACGSMWTPGAARQIKHYAKMKTSKRSKLMPDQS
jgi:hypothetical protein